MIILLTTEFGMYMKSSEYIAKILPDWIVIKASLIVLLGLVKIFINFKGLNKNYLWMAFSLVSIISIIYLQTYQPTTIFSI